MFVGQGNILTLQISNSVIKIYLDNITGLLGNNSVLDPPDPIPNSEVKRNSADDSVGSPHVKVGHCQAFIPKPRGLAAGLFYCSLDMFCAHPQRGIGARRWSCCRCDPGQDINPRLPNATAGFSYFIQSAMA